MSGRMSSGAGASSTRYPLQSAFTRNETVDTSVHEFCFLQTLDVLQGPKQVVQKKEDTLNLVDTDTIKCIAIKPPERERERIPAASLSSLPRHRPFVKAK